LPESYEGMLREYSTTSIFPLAQPKLRVLITVSKLLNVWLMDTEIWTTLNSKFTIYTLLGTQNRDEPAGKIVSL